MDGQPHVKSVVVCYFQELFASKDGTYAPIFDTLPQRFLIRIMMCWFVLLRKRNLVVP